MSVVDAAHGHEGNPAPLADRPPQPRIEGDNLIIPLTPVRASTLRKAIAEQRPAEPQPARTVAGLREAAAAYEDDTFVERYLSEVTRERTLAAIGDAAAALLFDVARQLGWGSGDPLVDVEIWLSRVIEEHGGLPKSGSTKTPRAQAVPAGHKKLHILAERDDGWRCHHCGIGLIDICSDDADLIRDAYGRFLINPDSKKRLATKDHLVPQSMNGSHDPANLVLACQPCNTQRGAYA
ncbi:HNH endonuclease [Sinosporangium album]|uniref:HNH endonuclease n=1 Tax=Sinosporangium album TaxID=504805 RepID=A0A1G8EHQ8_9ACTN|nr:HNH endonuclease signature motif containing protein [Sinosporangium album]SDH69372.1 HNH endonuclease [Sinosporangium album]